MATMMVDEFIATVPTLIGSSGAKVDYQVAAPAEMRTPNLHRAKIAQQRVRMEGWRQRRPSSKTRNPQEGKRKADLTLTGLLMEGLTGDSPKISGMTARVQSEYSPAYCRGFLRGLPF